MAWKVEQVRIGQDGVGEVRFKREVRDGVYTGNIVLSRVHNGVDHDLIQLHYEALQSLSDLLLSTMEDRGTLSSLEG